MEHFKYDTLGKDLPPNPCLFYGKEKIFVMQETENIHGEGKDKLIREWGGVDRIDGIVVDDLLSDENDWYVVREKITHKAIAVFDIRSVPVKSALYYKSMRLYFAPGFSLEIVDEFDIIQANLQKTSQVIGTAFAKLLEIAEHSQEKKVKIFSTNPLIRFLFVEIVRYLIENHPNLYTGKLHGNWIEIQTKEAENG